MRISDLVNRVEPFEFEFDGEKLTGQWYKYKTATPSYARALKRLQREFDERMEQPGADRDQLEEEQDKAGFKWLCDAIKSWDAEDDQGQPLPLTPEVFNELPAPFIIKFGEYLAGLRENPTQNGAGSLNGSSQVAASTAT